MTYENDKLVIPEKYRKMSVSELRKEREQIYAEYRKNSNYSVKKCGENKGSSLFKF
mgnify:CR=1 FL=1